MCSVSKQLPSLLHTAHSVIKSKALPEIIYNQYYPMSGWEKKYQGKKKTNVLLRCSHFYSIYHISIYVSCFNELKHFHISIYSFIVMPTHKNCLARISCQYTLLWKTVSKAIIQFAREQMLICLGIMLKILGLQCSSVNAIIISRFLQ
jgi:hypothetical protein